MFTDTTSGSLRTGTRGRFSRNYGPATPCHLAARSQLRFLSRGSADSRDGRRPAGRRNLWPSPSTWWQRHWELTGLVDDIEASCEEGGRDSWLTWEGRGAPASTSQTPRPWLKCSKPTPTNTSDSPWSQRASADRPPSKPFSDTQPTHTDAGCADRRQHQPQARPSRSTDSRERRRVAGGRRVVPVSGPLMRSGCSPGTRESRPPEPPRRQA
jgi:hypothetical protein